MDCSCRDLTRGHTYNIYVPGGCRTDGEQYNLGYKQEKKKISGFSTVPLNLGQVPFPFCVVVECDSSEEEDDRLMLG